MTGGSRGIGRAVAARLVDEGARVCITARHADALDEAAAALSPAEDRVMSVAGAAENADHQREAVERTIERFGRLDILINNSAANPSFGDLVDLGDDAARRIFDVNVIAALSWTRTAYSAWMQQSGGSVVMVGSVAGLRPARGIGMYGSSKAALMHLAQQLAVELSPKVRVNSVAPAVVKTKFAARLFEDNEPAIASAYPLGRLGEPHDVAAAVAFLASNDAAWITGHTLVVDGGLTLTGGV